MCNVGAVWVVTNVGIVERVAVDEDEVPAAVCADTCGGGVVGCSNVVQVHAAVWVDDVRLVVVDHGFSSVGVPFGRPLKGRAET